MDSFQTSNYDTGNGVASNNNHNHQQQQHHGHQHHHHHQSNKNNNPQAQDSHNNSSNNNNTSNMSKKEDFRKYLEKTGAIDALTKVLVGLYEEPERPSSAVDYIRRYLGSSSHAQPNVDVAGLQRENEELKARVEKLKRQLFEAQQLQGFSSSTQQQPPQLQAYNDHRKAPPNHVPASSSK